MGAREGTKEKKKERGRTREKRRGETRPALAWQRDMYDPDWYQRRKQQPQMKSRKYHHRKYPRNQILWGEERR